jgi:hypothetical protein
LRYAVHDQNPHTYAVMPRTAAAAIIHQRNEASRIPRPSARP